MKSYILTIILIATCSFTIFSVEPDLLVTQDGESIKVFNLDVTSSDNIYYTLSEDSNAPLQKISKNYILIIKKADGTKIDPNYSVQQSTKVISNNIKVNPGHHTPVTYNANSSKGNILNVIGNDNQEITMRILSQSDKTLAVVKPRKGLEYSESVYIIPEYVKFNDEIFTVTVIDEGAFKNIGFWANDNNIKEIVLPITLKEIGKNAFAGREGLGRIIIPDSVEKIGDAAFAYCGRQNTFEELFIPESVKYIGADAFRFVGPNTSYRGYFQGYLSSIPVYVTIGNCTNFGIDEEAVEAYEKRYK